MTLDTNAKTAYATAPAAATIYDTIELYHSTFGSVCLVRGYVALTNGGKTYQPYAFDYDLPSIAPGQVSEITVSISDTGRVIPTYIIAALESLEPILFYFRRHIIGGSVDSIDQPDMPMIVVGASESDGVITIKAAFVNLLDAIFPASGFYDITTFPGLA